MKKNIFTAITGTITLAFILAGGGCGRKEAPKTQLPAGTVSAEKNSFNAVAAQLDAGGNFYLYLSTEQLLENLSDKVGNWRKIFTSIPDMNAEDRGNVGKVFDVLTSLIKDSGVEDVSGFGMSSIAIEEKLYHSKAFLHHYSGRGKGFLWNLFGEKAHALNGLEMLPSSTVLAAFSDVDVSLMWSVLKDQVRQAGFPEAANALNQLPEKFEQGTGLKWDKVLGSLGGEFGVVVTLDDSKMITIPLGSQQKLEIPEPGLVIVVRVDDDTIFDRVDQALEQAAGPQIVRVDESGLKMRTVPVPLPMSFVRPAIATSGGYLFLALSDASIQEMLAVKSGKRQGLKSTEEFKHLAKNVPTEGNHFSFLSQRFGKTIVQLQKQALQMGPGNQAGAQEWFGSLLDPDNTAFSYSVSVNTDEGWLSVGNGNQNPAVVMAAAPVAMAAIVAAIAIPNFARARQTSQSNACLNNLRQIDSAKAQWALENNKKSTDIPSQSALQPYVGRGQEGPWPACPQGGRYTIGPVGDPPTCNHPGHRL